VAGPAAQQAAQQTGRQAGRSPVGFAPPGVHPTQLRIPSLGVRTALVPLGLDRAGALQVPDDPATAGWYVEGVVPGDVGPAVIAGHVDSATGPAVFYRLAGLRPGAAVEVVRSDGRTARFRVTEVARYPKTGFPTDRVYGPVPGPSLRLITCGGRYDRARRSYSDNVVVYAAPLQR
jgi:sortase (surface protein transpeptidase)